MNLRMRLASTLVEALADNLVAARDHATDARVGGSRIQPALGETQRARHVGMVGGSEHPFLVTRVS
jgi:hypothetical protein